MARPPAGPIGNSPRDVRDDAVGVPADDVAAPEPMRWPPKPKKITKNTFHAKVSGGKAPKRADRAPHFRKGGWVSGYASGGVIAKREEKPGEDKNDPFAKQNLKRGGGVKKKLADGGGVKKYDDGGDIEPTVDPPTVDPIPTPTSPNEPPVMPDTPVEQTGGYADLPPLPDDKNTAKKKVSRGLAGPGFKKGGGVKMK
jgi:hypothetical protein